MTENRTTSPPNSPPMIVAITGASGAIYGVRCLQMLAEMGVKTHLIVSKSAEITLSLETEYSQKDIRAMAHSYHAHGDIAAICSSGSFVTGGMIVAPCSMKTLAEIASGVSNNLISRSADVVLKERRRLVLMTRETPLHNVHLQNMLTVSQMGGIIMPPVPAFYTNPESLKEVIDHSVGRALDLFGYHASIPRWGAMGQS